VHILVRSDLNRAVTHLVFHIGQGSACFHQETAECMPEIMEAKPAQPGPFE